jgi:hypothetical protein
MPDLINSLFEFSAGIFILLHCYITIRDKATRGISIVAVIFFVVWGGWNLYYYPCLNQLLSFAGSIFALAANAIWIVLIIYYRRKNSGS